VTETLGLIYKDGVFTTKECCKNTINRQHSDSFNADGKRRCSDGLWA